MFCERTRSTERWPILSLSMLTPLTTCSGLEDFMTSLQRWAKSIPSVWNSSLNPGLEARAASLQVHHPGLASVSHSMLQIKTVIIPKSVLLESSPIQCVDFYSRSHAEETLESLWHLSFICTVSTFSVPFYFQDIPKSVSSLTPPLWPQPVSLVKIISSISHQCFAPSFLPPPTVLRKTLVIILSDFQPHFSLVVRWTDVSPPPSPFPLI